MDTIVAVDAVTKRWGQVLALDDVSVVVPPGVTGLLGANGAGKTTLLGLVLGFHRPDEGRIVVLGRDPATFGPEVRSRIGYAPEHDALPPDVRAQDLVRHVAELHGIPRRHALLRASEALGFVGLGEERFRDISTLSGGQKQRVKVAQAIAHDPMLVLLDEPTNGLDPLQRVGMLALLRRIGTELGIHVIISSHLMTEVEQVCDAVVVLDGGRLAGAGTMAGVRATGAGVVVEVDERPDALAGWLGERGLTTAPLGPRSLDVTLPEGDADRDVALATIRDGLAATGCGLRRLQPRTASLEEVFFTPVGEDAP